MYSLGIGVGMGMQMGFVGRIFSLSLGFSRSIFSGGCEDSHSECECLWVSTTQK